MSHPWSNLVVGGISNPRFLILYDNACLNSRFINNTDGWQSSDSSLVLSRISDVDSYSDYCGKMFWSQSIKEYVYYDIGDVGSLSYLSKVLINLRIKENLYQYSNGSRPIQIGLWYGGVELSSREILIDGKMKNISILFEGFSYDENLLSDTNLELRIFTGIDFIAIGDIRFDNVTIAFVKEDYQFDFPQDSYIDNDKENIGSHELFDGRNIEYNKSWRPIYFAVWEILSKAKEIGRQRIAEASRVFVIPHIDFLWGFFAKWNDKFSVKYSYKKYFGHYSEITLVGDELIKGTIHPIISEYIPPPITHLISISSNYDNKKGSLIYISPEDYNGFSDGLTSFTRVFETGTNISLLAQNSVIIDGVSKAFQDWYDLDTDTILTTELLYEFEASENRNIQARFIVSSSESGGYGEDYGEDYGVGF
jgi:hypothetical protein